VFRAEAGICGFMPQGVETTVNGQVVHEVVILRHADQVVIGAHQGVFNEICQGHLGASFSEVPSCLYCGIDYSAGEFVYQCPLCQAIYHKDCWLSLFGKRCCSRSCPFVPGPENGGEIA
jgi:hypothetical protein